MIYDVTENELNDHVSVSVYKSNEMIQVSENYFECVKKTETVEVESKYYETCKEKELGELVQETILTGGKESIEIGKDTLVIRDEKTDRTRYYYVVIEFLDKENQNEMMSSKLNGMDPVLKDELIPVTIENDGTVRRADESDNWYSYENQEWANAIILKEESESYCPGEIIEEEAIESYFVWIPKYRYQICELGDYMTHPAFLSIPSTGFWVGKFETSKGNSEADNSINPEGIQIKPNEVSWRNIQVANAFYTTYEYKRNLDSHMMKNTEWGSVAYL